MHTPRRCSWFLSQIFKLRSIAKQHISVKIGDGHATSFWFDPWCNGIPICISPSDPIISHAGIPSNAKVSSILDSNGWHLPQTNYHDMVVWKQSFNPNTPFNLEHNDTICWDGVKGSSINVTTLWQAVRRESPAVPWASAVWHKLAVPRYSFLHWQIMHKRVNTLSRLKHFGVTANDCCYFCINGSESIEHLFLECPFTQCIFFNITRNRGLGFPDNWSDWMLQVNNFNSGDITSNITALIFQIGAYSIWRERNNRFHEEEYSSPTIIAAQCLQLIKCRLLSSKWFEKEMGHAPSLHIWTRDHMRGD